MQLLSRYDDVYGPFTENMSNVKAVFGRKFVTPKRHIDVWIFWRILRQCPWWRLGCRR